MSYPMRLPSLKRFFLFFLLGLNVLLSAQNIPKKPAVVYPVYDEAGILSEQEKETLNQKLIKFSDSTSTEIEVIIIPTTGGQDVNFLATMYGEQWKIGQKEIDNGIVFLIATNDHTMSIQQGRAVEPFLTASVAGQIMDYLVTPAFKQGQWFVGIDRGTSAIMEAVQGKFKPIKKKSEDEDGGLSTFQIMLIIFAIMMVLNFFSKNSRGSGNSDDDDDVGLSRRGRRVYPGGFFPFPIGGGGFGGGSGGGGFGGFGGGGSFGGGGASGGW